MGNCCGKRLKGPKYSVSERRMEVDGKLFTEREETTITMDAYGKKTTMIEVTRTIAVGEKTCTVIGESNEGRSESVTTKIGLTPAEAAAFKEEWSLKWNQEHAEEVHSSTLNKKHRHHRKKDRKVGGGRRVTTFWLTSPTFSGICSHSKCPGVHLALKTISF